MTEQEASVVLSLMPGVKPGIMREVYDHCGSYTAFFAGESGPLPAHLRPFFELFSRQPTQVTNVALGRLEDWGRLEIEVVSLADDRYPQLLREIHRPPPILFVKGDVNLLSLPQIAIVGSRQASKGGILQAKHFASALAEGGFVVTSGMALGVDASAHRGAMSRGRTVAVLGTGVDVIYPRQHNRLYDEILASGGAVVSEFTPGSGPMRHHFPQRNRLISGLSLGVLIVEAAARSGSLITARLAMEQGREVFAIPGSVHNPMAKGCHQLIKQGAVLTETLDDIVEQLGGMLALKALELSPQSTPDGSIGEPLEERETRVLKAMGFDPVDSDQLQQVVDMDTAELTVVLVNLELKGFVENSAGIYNRIK